MPKDFYPEYSSKIVPPTLYGTRIGKNGEILSSPNEKEEQNNLSIESSEKISE